MFISQAYAQTEGGVVAPGGNAAVPYQPDATQGLIWNFGFVAILVAMFYLLLIRPQQKRFKEHAEMLSALKKGDSVVTSGGLIGKVDKIPKDGDEIVVDLGGGMKVNAVRSTIQKRDEAAKSAATKAATKAETK